METSRSVIVMAATELASSGFKILAVSCRKNLPSLWAAPTPRQRAERCSGAVQERGHM